VKALFWTLAIFALAVGLTLAAKSDPGYVLLVYPPYRIEFSLTLFAGLLTLLFALGYGAVRLATHTLRLPAYVRAFRSKQRQEKGRTAMLDGLIAYFEGRYGKAEKYAVTALEMQESPMLNAAVAARAAHEMRAFERRDSYLARAESEAPDHPVARLMTQAELLIDERRYPDALVVLKQLQELAPKHLAAQKLELKAQQQAKNWDQVLALLSQLEKREAIEPVQAEQLRINAHLENLKRRAQDAQGLKDCWQKISAADKQNGKIALAAARSFLALGAAQAAVEIIESSLDRQWDSELARLYGDCQGKEPVKQIERAEKWLAAHARDAALLLTLGRLCAQQGLWGKAQSYLEASLAVEPSSEAHIALAQHLEKANSLDEACKHYRKSLELALRR
jgi:HemY protein